MQFKMEVQFMLKMSPWMLLFLNLIYWIQLQKVDKEDLQF